MRRRSSRSLRSVEDREAVQVTKHVGYALPQAMNLLFPNVMKMKVVKLGAHGSCERCGPSVMSCASVQVEVIGGRCDGEIYWTGCCYIIRQADE